MVVALFMSAGGFRILRLQEVTYQIKSTTMGASNNQGRENGTNNLSMQGQTNFANIIEVQS